MKNKKEVEMRYKRLVVESITCDICKKTYNGEDWEKQSPYDVLETVVSIKTGTSYPEGGSVDETFFDICPSCFVDKLIPALKELGATPTTMDLDW